MPLEDADSTDRLFAVAPSGCTPLVSGLPGRQLVLQSASFECDSGRGGGTFAVQGSEVVKIVVRIMSGIMCV